MRQMKYTIRYRYGMYAYVVRVDNYWKNWVQAAISRRSRNSDSTACGAAVLFLVRHDCSSSGAGYKTTKPIHSTMTLRLHQTSPYKWQQIGNNNYIRRNVCLLYFDCFSVFSITSLRLALYGSWRKIKDTNIKNKITFSN